MFLTCTVVLKCDTKEYRIALNVKPKQLSIHSLCLLPALVQVNTLALLDSAKMDLASNGVLAMIEIDLVSPALSL